MTTMLRITDHTAEVLGPEGWEPADWVPLEDGNFLQINAEGFWSGWFQGMASGVLVALFTIGIVAWVVS